MWQGEVLSATPFTKRAGAPLAAVELRSADGTQRLQATQQQPAPDAEKITLTLIAELQYYDFGECPSAIHLTRTAGSTSPTTPSAAKSGR